MYLMCQKSYDMATLFLKIISAKKSRVILKNYKNEEEEKNNSLSTYPNTAANVFKQLCLCIK